jgi:hypothetical protein
MIRSPLKNHFLCRVSGNLNLAVSFKARKTIIKSPASRQRRLIVYHLSIVADATREILLLDRALKRTAKFNQSLRDKNYRLFLR